MDDWDRAKVAILRLGLESDRDADLENFLDTFSPKELFFVFTDLWCDLGFSGDGKPPETGSIYSNLVSIPVSGHKKVSVGAWLLRFFRDFIMNDESLGEKFVSEYLDELFSMLRSSFDFSDIEYPSGTADDSDFVYREEEYECIELERFYEEILYDLMDLILDMVSIHLPSAFRYLDWLFSTFFYHTFGECRTLLDSPSTPSVTRDLIDEAVGIVERNVEGFFEHISKRLEERRFDAGIAILLFHLPRKGSPPTGLIESPDHFLSYLCLTYAGDMGLFPVGVRNVHELLLQGKHPAPIGTSAFFKADDCILRMASDLANYVWGTPLGLSASKSSSDEREQNAEYAVVSLSMLFVPTKAPTGGYRQPVFDWRVSVICFERLLKIGSPNQVQEHVKCKMFKNLLMPLVTQFNAEDRDEWRLKKDSFNLIRNLLGRIMDVRSLPLEDNLVFLNYLVNFVRFFISAMAIWDREKARGTSASSGKTLKKFKDRVESTFIRPLESGLVILRRRLQSEQEAEYISDAYKKIDLLFLSIENIKEAIYK